MSRARAAVPLIVATCVSLTPEAGIAQTAGTAPGAADSGVEQVTVTAERRRQNAQTVGGSISVVSAAALSARDVRDVFDLQYLTPSLQVTPQFGSGQPAYAIRGVGFNDYASNNAPTVALYQDEVAFPVPFGTNGLMFDIQRVEVLRGPQGTLYGRNTTGGAINYVLNKPTDHLTGGLSAQYGSFDGNIVDGYISGPLGRSIQVRLSGETQHGGAWQHASDGALLGDTDRSGLRALVDAEPTDDLKVELNLHGSHDRSDAAGLHLYAPLTALAGVAVPADADRDATAWGTSRQFAQEIGIRPDQKPFSHIDTAGLSLRFDQQLSFATLTELASYDYMQRREYDNFDASPLSVADVYFDSRANVFSNELRLTSKEGGRLNWVAGLYYANQYLADIYDSGFQTAYGFDRALQYSQTVNTVSGFGQASYRIAPAFTLTGGLRIEHELRELNDFTAAYVNNQTGLDPVTGVTHRSTSYTEPSGKIELQYAAFAHDMVYASVSRGIKSGGFSAYNSVNAQLSTQPFAPEKLWAYEIGNKLELPREHVRFNISAFYYDYHDQQVQSALVNPQTGLVGAIVNAPRSHLYGGEFEIEWRPLRGLTLTQSAGWATGQFDQFYAVLSAVRVNGSYVGVYGDRKGDSLPAPKLTFDGAARYVWPFDAGRLGRYDLAGEIDYSLRSTEHSLFGTLYDVAGYTLVNTNLSLSPHDGRWTLAAFGQNILDKRYDVTRNYFVAGDDIALAGRPATWGVRLSAKF